MITDSKEYFRLLYRIQDENPPTVALLAPRYEPIIDIDLDTRTISTPEFLSINTDHRSETVYFKCARYYNEVDLSQMCGIIQYVNAAGEGRVYPIPFYDLDTCSNEERPMMLFPWCIEGEATKQAGDVKFSIRFYKLDTTGSYLMYNLNTLPATAKVLEGMDFEYDEIYTEVNLTYSSYYKGKYYILLKNGNYELCNDDFDAKQTYYEKTVLDNKVTDWGATFLEQMVAQATEIANHDLTWLVL